MAFLREKNFKKHIVNIPGELKIRKLENPSNSYIKLYEFQKE